MLARCRLILKLFHGWNYYLIMDYEYFAAFNCSYLNLHIQVESLEQ